MIYLTLTLTFKLSRYMEFIEGFDMGDGDGARSKIVLGTALCLCRVAVSVTRMAQTILTTVNRNEWRICSFFTKRRHLNAEYVYKAKITVVIVLVSKTVHLCF